ncbi:MAG TPA: MFS transporter [Candidatus Acidoferrales bacterium]|nr:MFS transporter [Candidatus Acidoferrales bacterium]
MSFGERIREIRDGFEPAFWVANGTELFERLAYYATTAVLAIYLHENLHLTVEQAGALLGIFGFVVWFLPVLGGTLADRFGFRRALMFAYAVMTLGYFLLGSLSASWMAPVRQSISLYWLVLIILMIPSLGPSVVKPCVAGTTARSSAENVRSIGYSIYYTIVNIGGALGPIVAFLVRKSIGIENVFRVSAASVALMFFATMFFYSEPGSGGKQVSSVAVAIKNMFVVLGNFRFMLFLLIFSSFYIVFWQEYVSLGLFLRGYVNPNANVDLLLSAEAITVICCQILVSYLTRKIPPFPAMTLGLLVTSLSWIILAVHVSTFGVILTLVVVALGEVMQSARYYEYISRLAPEGQQGLFMGYAFLPIAIGYFVAGPLGGYLLHHYGEVLHRPQEMWWVVTAVGVAGTILMLIYDRVFKPGQVGARAK